MKRTLCVTALAFLCTAGTLSAGNILIFQDDSVGVSAIPGALTLWGGCGICTTTTDAITFNAQLAGGGWDVVIYAEQSSSDYADSEVELTNYVNGGGRLIGQTWLQGGLQVLLQADFASANGTEITTDGSPEFAGLGATILLGNTGWGVFSQGWTPAGGAVGIGSFSSGGSAIILGNGGRTYLNAPLTDTYSTATDGQRLLANELGLLAGGSVPEPATFVGLGLGLAVFAMRRLRS